jgi:hypothetical protein
VIILEILAFMLMAICFNLAMAPPASLLANTFAPWAARAMFIVLAIVCLHLRDEIRGDRHDRRRRRKGVRL